MTSDVYQTYDIVLASFLIAGDVAKLTDITSNGDGRKLFCFSPTPCKEQLIQFYSGDAVVSARRFAEVFSTLKGTSYTLRTFP